MELLGIARGRAMLAPGALVVAEHSSKVRLAERYGELAQTRTLKQGDAALSFYVVADRQSVQRDDRTILVESRIGPA
jgi:hypothetical protein